MLNPMAMPCVHQGEDTEKNNNSRDEGSVANDASEKKNDVKQNYNNEGDCNSKWMHEGRIFRFIQKNEHNLRTEKVKIKNTNRCDMFDDVEIKEQNDNNNNKIEKLQELKNRDMKKNHVHVM